jgi:hypothetical protein
VFESGSGFDADVIRIFQNAMKDERQREIYRVGSYSIDDKRKTLPLQAADILAYEFTKITCQHIDSGNTRPARLSIRNLTLPRFNKYYYYDKTELLKVISEARERGMINRT